LFTAAAAAAFNADVTSCTATCGVCVVATTVGVATAAVVGAADVFRAVATGLGLGLGLGLRVGAFVPESMLGSAVGPVGGAVGACVGAAVAAIVLASMWTTSTA
jgi:hypothetical protein